MMNRAIKLAVASTLLCGGLAHADRGREEALREAIRQFEASLETQYQHCAKTAKTTNDFDVCLGMKANSALDAVNQKYQTKLDGTLDDLKHKAANDSEQVPEMLQQSQALWEQYAKAECNGLYEQNIAGTIRGSVSQYCRYRMALQRLTELDEW